MARDDNKDLIAEVRKLNQRISELLSEQRKSVDVFRQQTKVTLKKTDLGTLTQAAKAYQVSHTSWVRRALSFTTTCASLAALVLAVFSLFVSLDAARRHEITSTFSATIASCVSFDGQKLSSSVVQEAVLTNNGRLPITVVDVYDRHARSIDAPASFFWTSLSGGETHRDLPIVMGVGEAIAVRVVSDGSSQYVPLMVTLSYGTNQEVGLDTQSEVTPAAVEAAFGRIPECNATDQDPHQSA